ncbi:TrkA C-terminal domain-containing protein [Clostridium chrysemydis]|uniref:TrkA C-terminal domain-containing protein n=1 Tax=Clostridium chrysemydis TaxID=2665504 RepID=UPI0018831DA0
MVLILTFILFLTIFLLVINFFTILFRMTGLPVQKARFQVISLLSSTGYTTKESETIVQHPVRRKLASWLMIISYVSTATFISFFVRMLSDSVTSIGFFAVIAFFCIVVFLIYRTDSLEKIETFFEKVIASSNIWKKLNLLHSNAITSNRGYGVYEVYVSADSFLVGKSIEKSGLKEMEIEVLNIDKGDDFIKFATADYVFEPLDKLTVYGNIKSIKENFDHVSKKTKSGI